MLVFPRYVTGCFTGAAIRRPKERNRCHGIHAAFAAGHRHVRRVRDHRRHSHVEVDDALVHGGIFDRGTVGINWRATCRWKVGFDYGVMNLERAGVDGLTHAFHTRLQWIY